MKRVLLIVDDQLDVATCLKRTLQCGFDVVQIARDPADAERCLSDLVSPVTHILCDYFLDAGVPLGTELILQWRKKYNNIICAAVITGSQIEELEKPDGVDIIFKKPVSSDTLKSFFGITNSPSSRL